MSKTKIEWATHTVNWLAGCTKVSPACTHCYAESMSARLAHMGPPRYQGVTEGRRWTGAVNYDSAALRRAFGGLRAAKKPRRVFVNSMSDTFHKDAAPESLVDLAEQITALTFSMCIGTVSGHVLMLLTKRPERLLSWQRERFPDGLPSWVWVGCTVESQEQEGRIRALLQVRVGPGGVRYLSCEPMTGPVDFRAMTTDPVGSGFALTDGLGLVDGMGPPGIRWVITGGESGPKARPSHPQWFRDIRDQCEAAGVAYLHKQNGEHAPMDPPGPGGRWLNGHGDDLGPWVHDDSQWYLLPSVVMHRPGKKAAGRLLDGRTHDAFPVPR